MNKRSLKGAGPAMLFLGGWLLLSSIVLAVLREYAAAMLVAIGAAVALFLRALGALRPPEPPQPTSGGYVARLENEHRDLLAMFNNMQRNLDMARKIQQNMLPEQWVQPFPEDVRFSHFYQPEMAVGGDYYDLKVISDHELAIMLVDVSGHGMGAAFITGLIKTLLEFGRVPPGDPVAFVGQINEALCAMTPSENFAAVIYGIYNVRTRVFRFVNAGHLPLPILIRKKGATVSSIDSATGLLAGVERGIPYEASEVDFEVGDRLVLITDGIVDSTNANGDRLGRERVMKFLEENAPQPGLALKEALRNLIQEHCGDHPQDDDRTFLLMEVMR